MTDILKFSKKDFLIFSFVLFFGVFLSIQGESRALKSINTLKILEFHRLNPKIISAKFIGAALFGGFRGIIVDITWIYIDDLWHHGRFYKLPPLYEFITAIQPEYIDGWVMGAWHMAYNMSLDVENTPNISKHLKNKIELQWVYRGIDFLKDGIELNPLSAKLNFELGWTYYHRLKDYKNSIEWFEKSAVLKDSTYVTPRLAAYSYEKIGDYKTAYKKWLDLKKHPSYEDNVSKKIIDKNIERLNKITSGEPL
ncbi:MAG: hypothetical protein ACD_79C01064G0004 [uncultured bacterium]|nr:MAG: hypothetical protein ACD_79C01064G0004 [uncultured bacterium]